MNKITKWILVIVLLILAPFILAPLGSLLTWFAYTPQEAFASSLFWAVSGIYWVVVLCISWVGCDDE